MKTRTKKTKGSGVLPTAGRTAASSTRAEDPRWEAFEALDYLDGAFKCLLDEDDMLEALRCIRTAQGHLKKIYDGPLGTFKREASVTP